MINTETPPSDETSTEWKTSLDNLGRVVTLVEVLNLSKEPVLGLVKALWGLISSLLL